jgi:hypothetical protein
MEETFFQVLLIHLPFSYAPPGTLSYSSIGNDKAHAHPISALSSQSVLSDRDAVTRQLG